MKAPDQRNRTFATLVMFALAACVLTEPAMAAPDAADFSGQMDKYLSSDDNVKKIGDSLERYFRKKREQEENESARSESAKMEEQFKNPVKVDIGNSPIRGKADAKVTIVEFSDFQCPFCSRGASTMDEILKAYPNDVRIVFKNLPLPFHPQAKPAASAALAAGKQGKFWEMHDLLFKNQQSLSEESYANFAKDLGLDLDKFKSDMSSPETAKAIEADGALANSLGVRGTPGFFVNGVLVSGAQPFPAFKSIIDRWLAQGAKK